MLKTFTELFLKSCNYKIISRPFSIAAQAIRDERLDNFRTFESDPSNHSPEQLAQFYKLPPEDTKVIFQHGGLPKSFTLQTKTFNETCIMVRKPTLDVINYLKSMDYNKPPVKFVLYGKKGSGRSLALAHILHYGYKNNYLLVHAPWVGNWMRRCKDSSNSEQQEGFIDLNIDAAAWLLHFKTQNIALLKNPDLKIHDTIQWSKRESTPKDTSLIDLVDHGITRMKFASRCVNELADQIKKLSSQGLCKTLIAIDGFNAFFYPKTRIFTEKKELVPPEKVTLTQGFLNLTKCDWKNSAIVVTVDELAIAKEDHTSHFPRYLLGQRGFEHMDPFVPVHIGNYTDKEFTSILNYYKERKWLNAYNGIDEELAFLSDRNPYNVMELSVSL